MLRNEKVVGKGLNALKKRLSLIYESRESCPVPFHFSNNNVSLIFLLFILTTRNAMY